MFDMSWGEVMLIGGVALVVIGPKDLPRALRTVGQVTGKLKRMAGEFQSQFNEAMREAELDEVRREVEGVNRSVSTFNPVQTIRNELKGAVDAAGTKPSNAELASATAQLQAETDAAESAPDTLAPPDGSVPATASADAHPSPEADPSVEPPVPAGPRPSIDGAPLVSPDAAAGLEPSSPSLAPESVPAAPEHAPALPTPAADPRS